MIPSFLHEIAREKPYLYYEHQPLMKVLGPISPLLRQTSKWNEEHIDPNPHAVACMHSRLLKEDILKTFQLPQACICTRTSRSNTVSQPQCPRHERRQAPSLLQIMMPMKARVTRLLRHQIDPKRWLCHQFQDLLWYTEQHGK